jgi:hypothetical protein
VLKAHRHHPAGLGKLRHDLLVQPDVHFRRAIESASVAELLRQLFAGVPAKIENFFWSMSDRPKFLFR